MEVQVSGGEIDSALGRVEWVEKNLETLRKGTEAGLEVDVSCACALLQITELKAQAGEMDAVTRLSDRAERLLTGCKKMTEQRGQALRKLGQAWVQLTDAQNAVKRCEYLAVSDRVYVLAGIAEALAKRERVTKPT